MKKQRLRLYVWDNWLRDVSYGIEFALAVSPDQARRLIANANGDDWPPKANAKRTTVQRDLEAEPLVVDEPKGFILWGGA